MQVELKVVDTATDRIKAKKNDILDRMVFNLQRTAQYLLSEMQGHLSPTPNYSLKQLRQMDHPYAWRHWEKSGEGWMPRGSTPAEGIHEPPWEVNVQTGQLLAALKTTPVQATPLGYTVSIGVDPSSPAYEYAKHVIYGTRKADGKDIMVPRNFITRTWIEQIDVIKSLLLT